MMDWLDKEIRNQTIMILIGLLLFGLIVYIEGLWWAIRELINIYLAITIFDAVKKWLERKEME